MAKGKLVDKCRNMLYKSCNKSYIRKRKSQSGTSLTSETDEFEEKIFDEDIQSDVSWLKYNVESWAEVIEKWAKTFEIRQKSKTVNFLKEWAPLNHKDKAECLIIFSRRINIDFDLLFPDKNLKLYEDWNP